MKEKIKNLFLGRELGINNRIFHLISIVGEIAAIFAFVETLVVAGLDLLVIPLAVLIITIAFALYLSIVKKKTELGAILVGIVMSIAVFPSMFFLNGGIEGGATIWLVINIIYAFLILRGKKCIIMTAINCIVDVVIYVAGYKHPEIIKPLAGRATIYTDSLFSVIIVGLSIGAMIYFQIYAYEEERKIVKKQRMELEESTNSKDRFFASMSHELRTPINTIIGLNEMILRENTDDNVLAYSNDVQNAGRMLLSLVNDIIDLSQMELKKMEIVDNDYSTIQMISEIIAIVSTNAKNKKLKFFVDVDEDIPRTLRGDKKRIEQILINLLTNAIKYTNEGSISLVIKVENKNNSKVDLKISVMDTGIGIKKEDLENLYDAFKRINEKQNENVQGSGLGLTITKNLVDLMNGTISVDSIYTKGSTFTVMLSQQVVDSAIIGMDAHKLLERTVNTEKYVNRFIAPEARMLIVDDSAMNLKVASELLKQTQIQIDTVTSGFECLELTKKHFYNIIMLDHLMPGIDGIETMHWIKKQENGMCRDSVIFALSANTGSDMDEMYNREGFDLHIEKPIDGIYLEDCILKYLPDDIVEYNPEYKKENKISVQKYRSIRKKKVVITTDSIADISDEIKKKYDIRVLPFYIKTETGRFADSIEIHSDDYDKYIINGKLTARADGATYEEIEQFFAEQLEYAETVIHISMASNSYKTGAITREVVARFDHVKVIDSGNLACGQGILVYEAAQMAMEGSGADEIIEKMNEIRESIKSQFVAETVDMYKDNRKVNSLLVYLLNHFKLKPLFKMKKSYIYVGGVLSGNFYKTVFKLINKNLKKNTYIDKIICISYLGLTYDEIENIKRYIIENYNFNQISIHKISFSAACLSGPKLFGIAYYNNNR